MRNRKVVRQAPSKTAADEGHVQLQLLGLQAHGRGGAIAFNTKVERLIHTQAGWVVRFSGIESGELAVDAVVNSAGLGAQALARRTDDYPEQRVPRLVLARVPA